MSKAVNFLRQKTSKITGKSRQNMQNSWRHVLTIVLLYTHPQHSVNQLFASTNQSADHFRPTFINFSNLFLQISN